LRRFARLRNRPSDLDDVVTA